ELVSGAAKVGDAVVVMPDATSARIVKVEPLDARPGHMAIELDRPVNWLAGSMLAAAEHRPEMADQVAARIVWIGPKPLLPGRAYTIGLAGQTVGAQISALKHRIDPSDLTPAPARKLEAGDVG